MKKLLNKKGSVLFLVVVVMSILLVVASATYYIVSNQRQSVEVHYNSEQSYQTAYSVSQTIDGYFTKVYSDLSNKKVSYNNTIFKKMMDMGPTDTITAENDLKELGLGGYNIEIKKQGAVTTDSEGKQVQFFEVTSKADVNGETTSIVQVWKLVLSAEETPYFTRFLTSTGTGVKEDVYLTALEIFGETYFENDFTSTGNPTGVNRSVYTNGTLVDRGLQFIDAEDEELVVSDNFYIDSSAGGNPDVSRIVVGGDFVVKYKKVTPTEGTYILGDFTYARNDNSPSVFFVQQDCHIKAGQLGAGSTVYVGGDLYLERGDDEWSTWSSLGTFYVAGNVYIKDKGDGSGGTIYYGKEIEGLDKLDSYAIPPNEQKSDILTTIETALKNNSGGKFTNWKSVERYIAEKTAKGTYQDWDAEGYFNKHYSDSVTVDVGAELDKLTNRPYPEKISIPGSESSYIALPNDNNKYFIAYVNESCKFRPISNMHATGDGNCIVFDATDEDLYIYLDNNGYTVDGVPTFEFTPGLKGTNVLIKGEHSVIFVLPQNIDYKQSTQLFIGHYDLARYFLAVDNANVNSEADFSKVKVELAKLNDVKDLHGKAMAPIAAKSKGGQNQNQKEMREVRVGKLFIEDEEADVTRIDFSRFAGIDDLTVHNNIFLVTKGVGRYLKFDGQISFFGYVYAQNSRLTADDNTGSLSFIGGLVVGNYNYRSTSSCLAFVSPYDYYDTHSTSPTDRPNLVKKLMSIANEGSEGDTDPGKSKVTIVPQLVGYK